MESASQASPIDEQRPYPLMAAAPFLLSLGLAPLVAGRMEAVPALALALLVWISMLLRIFLVPAPLRPSPARWLAVAYALIVAATFFGSVNLGATVTQAVLYASYAAGLWLAADLVEHGRAGWLLTAILAGALLEGGLALREYLEHYKIGEKNWRVYGTFTNPNFVAGYLGPAILLTFGVALWRPADFKQSTWLLVLGLLTAALVSAFVATGSRGGILSFAAGAVIFLIFLLVRRRQLDREGWKRLACLGGVALAVALLLSGPIRSRDAVMNIEGLPHELCPDMKKTAAGESNQFRLLTWQATMKMGQARPVLGWGAGSYDVAFAPHAVAGFTRHAHNFYLQLFAEQGLAGLLAWLSLLGVAAYGLVRSARHPGRYWLPGVAAALTAGAVHNLFDSLLITSALPHLTWALLGMAVACRVVQEPEPARSEPRRRTATPQPASRRTWGAVVAVLLLLITGGQLMGQALAAEATKGIGPMNATQKLETLQSAEKFLPWDLQVALGESRAYASMGLDHLEDSLREARRALRIAPYRMPTYHRIGSLFRAQGRPDSALQQYEQGLGHAPTEAVLLYALAEVQLELGLRKEAMQTYKKLVDVEQSPVGQVRALAEHIEWRFARAHMVLANSLEATDPEQAFQHRKRAACLLAMRRLTFAGNPAAYMTNEAIERDLEYSLRADEEKLWKTLSADYQHRGDSHLSQLALEQTDAVDRSRERLEQILKEIEGAPSE